MTKRHPSTESLLTWLTANPRLPEPGLRIASWCQALSEQVTEAIPEDSPELAAGLRKLLEAKDCFVRAALSASANADAGVEVRETGSTADLHISRGTRQALVDFGWTPPAEDGD